MNFQILRTSIISAATALCLCGCDDIAGDERFIKMDNITPQRAVLLVDFTGQNCSNCPDAHETIETLEKQWGDSLIAVSIHGGALAFPIERTKFPNRVYLCYQEGNDYDTEYNTLGFWPAGNVNLEKPALEYTGWAAAVRKAFTYPSLATVKLDASVQGDELTVTANISSANNVGGHLQVWLLEDSIVAPQVSSSGAIPGYVHNNVFRRAINGLDGTEVTLEADEPKALTFTCSIADSDIERFNHDNLKVVGFIRTSSTLLEAAEVKVTNLN